MRHLFVAGALVFFPLWGVSAQDQARLRSTRTFRCLFTVTVAASMDGETPKAKSSQDNLELVFDQVDRRKGTARMIGNIGSEDVTVDDGMESTTFIERTASGSIQVTVIYLAQLRDGRFKAVHSRHTAMPGGTPIASQMYGACSALK